MIAYSNRTTTMTPSGTPFEAHEAADYGEFGSVPTDLVALKSSDNVRFLLDDGFEHTIDPCLLRSPCQSR